MRPCVALDCCRFAIGAMSFEDLASGARSPIILSPTPHCVDERRCGSRPIMQRFFQVPLPCLQHRPLMAAAAEPVSPQNLSK